MSLAQFSDVTFGYPGTEILSGASLLIRPGERLALLGPNGTGKSTALRLLAGDLAADSGDVRVLGRASVAYLRQSQEFAGAGTLMDALLEPFAALQALHDEMTAIEHRLGEASPAEVQRYGELQERYLREGGYELESRVRRLTADIGFSEADLGRSVATLSGGERGRLELAKVLVRQPDLLLLDEPTNHLDLAAIERLETFLADYPGAFVLVSHDRAFIRAVCREVVELENGKFVRYPFGYDKYIVERDARLERARAEYERQKEHVDKTEDFIRRNLAGQKTKQAQSRRKMLEKLDRLERPEDHWQYAGKIGLSFSTGDDLGGKETIRAPHITVGYPGAPGGPILRDVTVNIYRGDKVGIVGPNGAGKSTLLKTLIGQLAPLAGKVETGTGVRIGYFDQKLGTLSEDLSLIDEIRSVRADLSPEYVRSYLAKFRFFGDDPFRTVRGLSGGERSRLAMAKIMLFPRNVLVLDEPTNHLDIPARETLEEALSAYQGTLLVVSHDRYFLDRICTRLLVIEGTSLEAHLGNYSDWRRRKRGENAAAAVAAQPVAAQPMPAKSPPRPTRDRPPAPAAAARAPAESESTRVASKERERERRRLEKRVEILEADVGKLESDLRAVRAELGGDHAGDWQKLHALADRERELDALLARRMSEWESASAALAAARVDTQSAQS
ncbi:MAG TPA: ABC-F family ATP-binding cassette domain-containing protein [Polyangia bacterium]|nr:ABC-F family ATP-binding cassette domain-containing protein [Polyangia bacterium]